MSESATRPEKAADVAEPASTYVPGPDGRRAQWIARLRRIRARQIAHNYNPDWEPEAICRMMLDSE